MSNLTEKDGKWMSYDTCIRDFIDESRFRLQIPEDTPVFDATLIRDGQKTIGNATRYSNTTSKHQVKVDIGSCDIVVYHVPRGTKSLREWWHTLSKEEKERQQKP